MSTSSTGNGAGDEQLSPYEINENLKVVELLPERDPRLGETPEFLRNVKRMKADGYDYCIFCLSKTNVQYHHGCLEHCLEPKMDPQKLYRLFHVFNVCGYATLPEFDGVLPTSTADIRNLWPACIVCHIMQYVSMHETPVPIVMARAAVVDGYEVIPQDIMDAIHAKYGTTSAPSASGNPSPTISSDGA